MSFTTWERSSISDTKDLLRALIINTLFEVPILEPYEVNMIVCSLISGENTESQLERYVSSTLPRPKIKLLKALCISRRMLGAPTLTRRKRALLRRLYPECFTE